MRGYTLIELIVSIVVLSIAITGIALLFLGDTEVSIYSKDLIQAENLARLEATKVENLSFSDVTLASGYNNTTTAYEGYPLDLNRQVAIVAGTSDNLKKVTISVYPTGTTEPLISVITYKANVAYGSGSGGGAPSTGGQADSLSVSGGTISGKNLSGITMENIGIDSITVTKAFVTFTGASGIKLKTINMDGAEKWAGTASSGVEITLDTTFVMSGSTSYGSCSFTFSKNVSTVTVSYYEFSDASQSSSYAWP